MPIRLPKSFQRRRSSANALEEVPNPPEPSFRVFERPRGIGKSIDGGFIVRRHTEADVELRTAPKSNEEEEDNDDLFPASKAELDKRYAVVTYLNLSG